MTMLERIKRLLVPRYEYRLTYAETSWGGEVKQPESGFEPWKWLLKQEHGHASVAVVWRRKVEN